MRRDPLPWVLLLVLVLAGGVAWLTHYPESPLLDRLAGWPLIGPAAERFRDLYRPPPPAPPREPEVEVVILGREEAPRPAQPVTSGGPILPRIWLRPGTRLRQAPEPGSAVTDVVAALTIVRPRRRQGDWYRVSRVVPGGRSIEGWVRASELDEPGADELWAPAPVLPLAAMAPEPELIGAARGLMAAAARVTACGPYRLITDAGVAGLAERCARLAGGLDRIYAERYGLEPAGPPAEAILIFGSRVAYWRFAALISPERRRDAFAAPGHGVVAMTVADKRPQQVQATLAHELAHLLNRRFLGPALPPWLDEGMAEELSISRFGDDGRLLPGTLAGWSEQYDRMRLVGGGQVDLDLVRRVLERGELPGLEELMSLDRQGFHRPERRQMHYSLSAFWVRYLLTPEAPGGGGGFRDFLAAVASGEPLAGELLLARLGSDWDELETGFRGWLPEAAERPGQPG